MIALAALALSLGAIGVALVVRNIILAVLIDRASERLTKQRANALNGALDEVRLQVGALTTRVADLELAANVRGG